jgi:hypothetical protein
LAAGQQLPCLSVPLLEPQATIVMANCSHNQLESLAMRYLKETPALKGRSLNFDLIFRIVKHLAGAIRVHYSPEFNFNTYVKNKTGAVRRRFLTAYSQMVNGQRDMQKNARISAFIKNERYFEEGKSPRSIMGRDPKFNIIYARFVARFEDAFFKLDQVCNACDNVKSGAKFTRLYARSKRMFENDMSKFEASQQFFVLLLEFMVMDAVTPESEREDFARVFAAKILKPVGYQSGFGADFENCRGSGDLDTSTGNGVINYISTMYFKIVNFCTVNCPIDGCSCGAGDFVLKGDDSYGTVPERHKGPFVNTYEWFGLDAKLIDRPDGRLVEFCSGNFIRVRGGHVYVQNLRKTITSVSTCINPDVIKNGWLGHYLKSLGDMYAILYQGIPIYSDFAEMLRTTSSRGINLQLIEGHSYGAVESFKLRNTVRVDAVPETILDISLTNQMTLPELEALRLTFCKTRIALPDHLMRRCNLRNREQPVELLDETISRWVNHIPWTNHAFKYYQVLRSAQVKPIKAMMKACFA